MLGAGATVMDNCAEAWCPRLSVTCTVKEEEPAAVGTPVRFPLLVTDTPAGGTCRVGPSIGRGTARSLEQIGIWNANGSARQGGRRGDGQAYRDDIGRASCR